MKRLLNAVAVMAVACAAPVSAQQLSAGSKVTIDSDWHRAHGGPYKPKVTTCKSDSGLCLSDKRLSPSQRPMKKTGKGLQVDYPEFGVIYLFQTNGKGTFYDMKGKPSGTFMWSQ